MFNKKQKEDIILQYQQFNIPIDKIMLQYGCTERDIRLILKNNQIDRQYNTFSDELYQRIIFLYQSGYKQKEIAETLVIGLPCIVKTLKKNSVRLRSYSENNKRFNRDSHYFDIIDTPNKAYILGLIYADGNNYRDHNALTISLQEEDGYLLEQIRKEIKYEGALRYRKLNNINSNHKNQVVLNINDEHMSAQLERLGVIDAKSLQINYPDFLSAELERHFIRGIFDGDGCISFDAKRNKTSTVTVGTLSICQGVYYKLKSIGCKSYIYHAKSHGYNTYNIRTSGNKSSYLFLSYIYDNCDLKMIRKYNKYLNLCSYYQQKIA